jgi:hypothetical protein
VVKREGERERERERGGGEPTGVMPGMVFRITKFSERPKRENGGEREREREQEQEREDGGGQK